MFGACSREHRADRVVIHGHAVHALIARILGPGVELGISPPRQIES